MGSRGRRWGAAVAVMVLVALSAPSYAEETAPPPPSGYLPTATWQLLAEVNKHRRSRGLPALALDKGLAAAARTWAERMASSRTLAHNDPLFTPASKSRLGMRMLGENVGFNTSVGAQHRAFLASPQHRAILENASFRVAGFAVVRDSRGYLWSTEDFGTPRS